MTFRTHNIARLQQGVFDVLIIGGGINGAVSAAALAARGAKVALIDAGDFAGFTSQQSSNLVWGGIKYMEGYEFDLVAGLCKSRNKLLKSFPSTVQEIRFLLTVEQNYRFHPWVILASTWLYWLLGRGKTRTPRLLSCKQIVQIEPTIDTTSASAGVEYSDAYLHDNDARFVFNFIRTALDNGCVAANYVKSIGSTRETNNKWVTKLSDQISGASFCIRSQYLINATGAFVDELNAINGIDTKHCHLFSKGVHLLLPRLSQQHQILAFFANDHRVIFSIPMANRTCIGTTDTQVASPHCEVTEQDRDFLLNNINERLRLVTPLTREHIIAERCGVRPLAIRKKLQGSANVQKVSRRHAIEVLAEQNHISIFGGKLTDCLNVGNEICRHLQKLGLHLQDGRWYGEANTAKREQFFQQAHALQLDKQVADDTRESLSQRLWRRYGEHAFAMLKAIAKDASLSDPIIANTGIRRCEVDYLANREMIVKLDDLLRRRSKIALLVPKKTLRQAKGLMKICERLFGAEAKLRFDEYFK